MPTTTDLNVTPYFDDFDEDKKFHKVLFRPSVPVQARELTQLQTILQNQVERFGDHIFKEGSIIKGCGLNDSVVNYAKLNDANTSSDALVMSEFADTYVVNSSNLISLVAETKAGFEATNPDLNTIYYHYVNSGNNSGVQVTSYSAGETLDVYDQNASINAVTLTANTGTAYSNADTITFSSTFGTNAVANLTTNSTGGIVSTSFNNTASQGHSYRLPDLPTVASITTSTGSTANLELFVAALTKKNIVTIANTSFEDSGGNTEFNSIGSAVRIRVRDGVIYQKGVFEQVTDQSIMVTDYTNSPNNVAVGFETIETIANNTVDTSLNDNASGFLNENAPGAFRLKLTPTLVVNSISNAESTNNFFIVQRWESGRVVSAKTSIDSGLAKLGDKIARRTKEESGSYVTRPFQIGSEAISSNTTHFNVTIGPGVGYINGYRAETIGTSRLPVGKATSVINVSTAVVTSNYGQYQLVDELVGHFAFNHAAEVKLLDGAGNRISSSLGTSVPTVPTTSNSTVITGTSPSFTGNILGTAKIRSSIHEKNTPGTPSGQYRLYLFDINMNQGKRYQDVRSIWYNAEGIADVTLNDNSQASLKETDFRMLARPVGRQGIKTHSINGISNNQYIFRTAKTDGSLATNGSITFDTSGTETFPYTASAYLNETQEADFVLVSNNTAAQTVSLTGTVAVTSGAGNVTGTSTTFTNDYEVGDYIKVADANTHRVTSVVNSTLMVTANNFGASVSGKTHVRYFPADLPINLFDNSAANVYVGADSNTVTINATRGKNIYAALPVHVYYNVKKTSAPPIGKTLATSFVKINCASHSTTTTQPWSLGLTDVYDTLAVYVGNDTWWDGTTAANSTVLDRTTNFVTTTGQKDGFYGLAQIGTNKANAVSIASTDRIVAKVRHFKQDTSGGGKGFYTIDSYPVNDTEANSTNEFIKTEDIPIYTSPVDGQIIDLRNTVDFRPVVANTANANATAASGATINPSGTESFAASEHSIAAPNKNFVTDYQYYVPRIDRVVMNQDGMPEIIKGAPSENPLTPSESKDSFSLGVLNIPVYPSLSAAESVTAGRTDYGVAVTSKQQRNYTMKDIGQIERRIGRLEYYTSLNLLEKQTKDLVIPAESNNAVDRFKQGFLVDSFKDFSIAAATNEEYKAAINKSEQTLVPKHRQNKIDLEVATTTNTTKTGDLVLLNYTHVELAKQRFATVARSAAQDFWSYEGDIELYPNYDNFYETRNNPVNEINIDLDLAGPALSLAEALNTITSLHEPRTDIIAENITTQLLGSRNQTTTSTSGRSQTTTTSRVDTIQTNRDITERQSSMLFAGTSTTETKEIGEFVTDISFSPFIREQNIHFHAYGLRPGVRHYVFFDQTDVNSSTRPAVVPDGLTVERDNFHPAGALGANLISDSTGNLYGILQLAQGQFFVGDRRVVLADVDTYDDIEETSISNAETSFNAYNFSADKSDLTLTTRSADFSRTRTTTGITSRVESSVADQETVLNRTTIQLPPPPSPPQRRRPAPRFCFIAGTKVIMDGHTEKNIEDVVVGDKVHRHDGGTNEVLKLQNSGTTGGRKLGSINGGDHFFTEDHPLKTPDGWKAINAKMASQKYHIGAIGELRVGDTIIGHAGDDTVIESIDTKDVPHDTQIYNFELDGDHEYFANGFLVHNKCFRAGTKVIDGDGNLKLIEDVEVDEELVGKDGMINKVSALHRPKLGDMDDIAPHKQRMVSINGGGYDTSEDHMFFTTEGWKTPDAESCKIIHKKVLEEEGIEDIQSLQVGDRIHSVPAGGTVEIESIEFKEDDSDLQLYNFVLTGNRTYHVVMEGHDEPLLVHNKCFRGDTKVLMVDGSLKDIKEVKIGDKLLGEGGEENEVLKHLYPVLDQMDTELPHKLRMASINGSGFNLSEDHMVKTTEGWKAPTAYQCEIIHAEVLKDLGLTGKLPSLKVGDHIYTSDGSTVEVKSIGFAKQGEPNIPSDLPLYNFVLSGNKTYHVVLNGYDTPLLVHNKCFRESARVIAGDGSWKLIKDVDVGDEIIGKDGSVNKVIELHRPKLGDMNDIISSPLRMTSINGGGYDASEDHMFMTTEGWRTPNPEKCKIIHKQALELEGVDDIQALQVGDELVTSDDVAGETVSVESIEFREDSTDLQLYNFILEGNKTYHVIMEGHDTPVLVHNKDPIAQTFRVTPVGAESSTGIYLTKMDLYFKSKHQTLGITVEIRKTTNGYPTKEVIPFGRLHLKASDVNISDDGQTATTVTFSSPVYLAKAEEYCFVILPDNDNPDYFVWISKTGGKDVSTSQPVNSDGFIGSLFFSSNDSAWKPNTDEDAKFTLYRASFSPNTGTVAVQNKDYEYLTVNSINGTFKQGEIVFLSNSSAQTTGTVTMSTSNNIVTGTGTSFDTEYAAGQYLTFANATSQDVVQVNSVTNSTQIILKGYPLLSNTTGIAAHHTPVGKVFFYDSTDTFLYLDNTTATNSTFKFSSSVQVIGAESGANATVQSVDNKKVSHFEPLLYRTTPLRTSVSMYVHANTATGDSGNTEFKINDRNYFKDEVLVKSKSNDLTGKWKQYFVLETKDAAISPTIDTQSLSDLIYENVINNDTTNEHLTAQGNTLSKYLSRVVTLEDALDAEDLRVYLTAFKPGADNCDIKVYGKILNEADTDLFADRHWTELEIVGQDERSNDDNRYDYREYIYQIPQTPASTFVEKGQTYGNTTITTASDISSTATAGTLVKVTNTDAKTDYQISTVASSNSTVIVLDEAIGFANNTGADIATVTLSQTAFKDPQNSKVATYYNSGGAKFATYKVFAVKILLLSDDISTVPAIKDYRALALSV